MSFLCKTSRTMNLETTFIGSKRFCVKGLPLRPSSKHLSGVRLSPALVEVPALDGTNRIISRLKFRIHHPVRKRGYQQFRHLNTSGTCFELSEVLRSAVGPQTRNGNRSVGIAEHLDGWRWSRGSRALCAGIATEAPSAVNTYDADQIQVLEGLDPVRKRPGMYIGSTGPRGLHHLVWEVLDNSIDEVQAGFATQIDVELMTDGSISVSDDGRGIPTGVHPSTGKSAVETVLTVLHAGGKFGGDSSGYSVSGGLHGVGISVVNALSETLQVTIWRSGQEFEQFYERGKPVTELTQRKVKGELKSKSGTRVIFKPDKEVFTSGTRFDYDTIAGRTRELAFLNSKVSINLKQAVPGTVTRENHYHFAGGLIEYVLWLNQDKERLHEPISIRRERDGITVDIALQWLVFDFEDE